MKKNNRKAGSAKNIINFNQTFELPKNSQGSVSSKFKNSNVFNRKNIALLCLFVIMLSIILSFVHSPALSANVIFIDDGAYLTKNPLIKNPSLDSAKTFLTEVLRPSTVQGYYQPLAMISLMLDYQMGGRVDNLKIFHRTSLILHILNACLIMLLLQILFNNPYTAFFTALLFGTHPMTVETIAWVGERKTTLATFFSLICLVFYVLYTKKQSRLLYGFCLISYVLALMSKPTGTMLPIAFIILDFWPLKRMNFEEQMSKSANNLTVKSTNNSTIKSAFIEKLPFIIIGAISAIITYLSQKYTASVSTPFDASSLLSGIWRICHNLIFYPIKMLYPTNLSPHYPVPKPLTLGNPEILLSVIGTIALTLLLIFSLRKTRALLTGVCIFFVLILPATGVIGFTNTIASDKYAYLPSIGFLFIFANLLNIFWDKINKYRIFGSTIIIILMITVTSTEAKLTNNYLKFWQDGEKIYRYMVNLAPKESLLYQGLGHSMYDKKNIDDAISNYKKAIELDQNNSDAYNNLAVALKDKGDLYTAISYFKKAVSINPKDGDSYNNLAILMHRTGQSAEASEYYKKALSLNSFGGDAYNNYANYLKDMGNIDEAIKYYTMAINSDPKRVTFQKNLGIVLLEQGKTEQAVQIFKKVLNLNPNDTQIKLFLKNYDMRS